MGNHHSNENDDLNFNHDHHYQKQGFVARRRQKLEELKRRRQSMPLERLVMDSNGDSKHNNFTSFAYGDREENLQRPVTPRIQINGQDSTTPSGDNSPSKKYSLGNQVPLSVSQSYSGLSVDLADNQNQMRFTSPLAASVDGSSIRDDGQNNSPPKRHRFIRNPKSAATRRMEFLSFSQNFVVRSLDEPSELQGYEIEIKPLSHRARSLSPLKQLRTYSMGRHHSDENVLTPEHCQLIKDTWKSTNEIITLGNFRPFGFLVLKRALEKLPALRSVFKLDGFSTLEEIPIDHSFVRHCGLFQSIIDLGIRNIDCLDTEIAPAVFIYGRRHFDHDLHGMFNEETVRMFCGQVVCTVIDIIGIQMSRESLEAWIEFMRYLGRALLNGYEYESLNRNNKFAINTKDHTFFIA